MKITTTIRAFTAVLGVLACATGVSPGWASAGENISADDGKALFQAKCSPCHTIGAGKLVGPDLQGVTALRGHDWIERFISAPDRMFASGDPVANRLLKEYGGVAMPNLGLSHSQVDNLVAYLDESVSKKEQVPTTAPMVSAVGDPQRGAALFTGMISFQQGGAPCLACHTVSGVSPLGGGSLGPDLTGTYGRLGEAGLASVLATLPFPTMRPIFQTCPLTQTERGDLAALFRASAGRQLDDAMYRITMLAVAGVVLLLFLAGVVWRKRLKSVRQAFVTAMTEKRGNQR